MNLDLQLKNRKCSLRKRGRYKYVYLMVASNSACMVCPCGSPFVHCGKIYGKYQTEQR